MCKYMNTRMIVLLDFNFPKNLNSNMSASPPKVIFLHIDVYALGLGGSGFQKPPPLEPEDP